jgi:hypothetical protein
MLSPLIDWLDLSPGLQELYAVDGSSLVQAHPHDFEKDDDSNFHIDFLTVATNARAWNYNIKQSTRHEVKVTAGKIIPAMATTTSAICGMVDIEFCKLVLGLQHSMGSSPFLNCNFDLAVPTFNAFRPFDAKRHESPLGQFCSWDIMDVRETEAPTLEALVDVLTRRYGQQVEKVVVHTGVHGKIGKVLYEASDRKKLGWSLGVSEDGKCLVAGGSVMTDSLWKSDLLSIQAKLPTANPGGPVHKQFLANIASYSKSIDTAKLQFSTMLSGSVKDAYAAKCRPEDSHEAQECAPSPYMHI